MESKITSIRGKLQVQEVTLNSYCDTVKLTAVYSDKNAEDNTFASATPSAEFVMQVTNPALRGYFKPGQKFYLDFTPAD